MSIFKKNYNCVIPEDLTKIIARRADESHSYNIIDRKKFNISYQEIVC